MKKLIGFLLALCLMIGMLPMAVLAETEDPAKYGDWAKIRFGGNYDVVVRKGQPAQYVKTDAKGKPSKGTEDNWNIRLHYEQNWVVMTLKGAKIGTYDEESNTFSVADYAIGAAMLNQPEPSFQWKIVIEEDSYLTSKYAGITAHGGNTNPWGTNMTIESVGDAKLTIFTTGNYGGLMDAPWPEVDYTLTINANLDITSTADYINSPALSACNIVINGGDIKLNAGYRALNAAKSLTINGGTISATTTNESIATPVYVGTDMTVNGGTLKMYKTNEGGGGCVKADSVTINGGNVYGEGYTYGINADTVEINGGVVELFAASEEGDAQAFVNGAPDLAKFDSPAAVMGATKDDVKKYNPDDAIEVDTGYFKVAKTGTADAPEVPADEPEPTDPPVTEPPATSEPPATNPPATSETPEESKKPEETKKPEESKKPEETKKPSGNDGNTDNNADDGSVIIWVVCGIVILAVCGATVFIVLKRRSAAAESDDEDTAE